MKNLSLPSPSTRPTIEDASADPLQGIIIPIWPANRHSCTVARCLIELAVVNKTEEERLKLFAHAMHAIKSGGVKNPDAVDVNLVHVIFDAVVIAINKADQPGW